MLIKNQYFASGGKDKKLKIWDINKNCSFKSITLKGEVIKIKHLKHYNLNFVATGGSDKVLNIINALSGEIVKTIPGFCSMIFNIITPYEIDNQTIILTDEKNIYVINILKGEIINCIHNAHDSQEGKLTSLMYSKRKEILVSGARDGSIKIWTLKFN